MSENNQTSDSPHFVSFFSVEYSTELNQLKLMENTTTNNATFYLVQTIIDEVYGKLPASEQIHLCYSIICTFRQNNLSQDCDINSSNSTTIKDDHGWKLVNDYISLYIYPIFIFLGIFGNSLSSFLMLSNVRRGSAYPASVYLTVLALVDCLFLIIGALPDWISRIDEKRDLKIYSNFSCRFVYWFGNIITHLSAALVVALTVERFIAVQYPLIAHKISTVTRTRCALICILIFYLILDIPVFMLVQHEREPKLNIKYCPFETTAKFEIQHIVRCSSSTNKYGRLWAYVDLATYALIPFLIIITLNLLIIRRLLDAQRFRQHMFRFQNRRSSTTGSFELKSRHLSEIYRNSDFNGRNSRNQRRFQSLPDTKPLALMLRPQKSLFPI